MRDRNDWSNAHVQLKRLYEERVPTGMTQKVFGRKYGIGSQSMVAQYLNGTRPLNIDAATKFAKGLRCTIYDICPEMSDYLRDEVYPMLGKAMRRAAAYAVLALGLTLLSGFNNNAFSQVQQTNFFDKSLNRIHIVCLWILTILTSFSRILDWRIRAA